jgi:hypothetical protein
LPPAQFDEGGRREKLCVPPFRGWRVVAVEAAGVTEIADPLLVLGHSGRELHVEVRGDPGGVVMGRDETGHDSLAGDDPPVPSDDERAQEPAMSFFPVAGAAVAEVAVAAGLFPLMGR